MRVGIAADHGGFTLKEDLRGQLAAAGHDIVDFGARRLDSDDDYPVASEESAKVSVSTQPLSADRIWET